MADVVDMIRANVRKEDDRREQIRRKFPLCAEITEQLRAAFGPGVKPIYFSEGGKTMGKPAPDFVDNTFKYIWLTMTEAERNASLRSGK